jgi:hypothetical protein
MADGKKVVLKRVGANEAQMALSLSALRHDAESDESNIIIPVLAMIELPQPEDSVALKEYVMVTPILRPFDNPGFHCLAEFINAALQFLQVELCCKPSAMADSNCRV